MQDWKLVHRPDVLKALKQGHPPPIAVQFSISDLCNQDCGYCQYRMSGYPSNHSFKDEQDNRNPKRQLETQFVLDIFQDLKDLGTEAIEFSAGGEPTIHPDFARIVSDARSKGFDVGVITNAMKLSDEALEALKGISWVRVSIDAAKAETYSKIRGIGKAAFQHVLSNLEKLKPQVLGINFLITKENYLEIEAAKKLFSDKAHYIRFSNVRTVEKNYYSIEMLQAIRSQLSPEQWEYFWDRFQDQARKPHYSMCQQQRILPFVGGDAKLYRCCEYAYNPHGLLGDLQTQSFKELWLQLHDSFLAFDAKSCGSCPYNAKNKFINYALSEIQHKKFL